MIATEVLIQQISAVHPRKLFNLLAIPGLKSLKLRQARLPFDQEFGKYRCSVTTVDYLCWKISLQPHSMLEMLTQSFINIFENDIGLGGRGTIFQHSRPKL